MSLTQLIAEFKETLKVDMPEEVLQVLNKGVEDLLQDGVGKDAIGVGNIMPAFQLKDARGALVSSDELLAKGPLVVSFYRGDWCPYCNLELRALQAILPEITKHNVTLVAISPEQPDDSLSTEEKNELTFPVLSDQGLHVAKPFRITFGLPQEVIDLCLNKFDLDLRKINGVDNFDLPIPATYVVGQDSVVRYAFVDADYTTRAEPTAILQALEQLSAE
jgi:peroxiredoxin